MKSHFEVVGVRTSTCGYGEDTIQSTKVAFIKSIVHGLVRLKAFKAGILNPWATDWYLRNRAAQQEVSSRQVSEATSVFAAAPQC
mgnify:CR=1 FL=1